MRQEDAKQNVAASAFDKDKAWSHLLRQVSFGPRVPGTEGHIKCRDWIAEEMKKHCENVRFQPFSHTWSRGAKKLEMWNVLGEQNWKDAKVRVLLLAHWDTRPYSDEEYDVARAREPVTGANDAASGVAVLLEVMRVLKDKLPKDVGILYLMTDGEDLGPTVEEMLLGARYFAKHQPELKPEYGILLDMIGDRDLRIPVEPNSYRSAKKLVEHFYAHAKGIGLEKTFPNVFGPDIVDDHTPLNEAGLPTMDLIDFDYPAWHTTKDTPERCSADSLGKVGLALETWMRQDPPFTIK